MEKVKHILEALDDLLNDFGITIGLVVAGFFGALVSLEEKKGLNWWQKLSTFIGGAMIANYVTPVLIDKDNVHMMGFLGFILGYSGLKGLKFIILKVKERYGNRPKLD